MIGTLEGPCGLEETMSKVFFPKMYFVFYGAINPPFFAAAAS